MKPILFNTEMVKALLDGRKTVTRRIVKPQPPTSATIKYRHDNFDWAFWSDAPDGHLIKPPYRTGDILYVRETFCTYCADHVIDGVRYAYKADATPESERIRKEYCYKYRPSIHMPREAARIFLRVTRVRVERLQDITPEGAMAEGCDGRCECPSSGAPGSLSCVTRDFSVERFQTVWDSTLPKNPNKFKCPENSWATNPFVWVIEFERISKEDAYNA